jgi:hypothetical protein
MNVLSKTFIGVSHCVSQVYLDDLNVPVLVTALNLASLLKLYHGRAWVGFTAATGHSTWQTQVGTAPWFLVLFAC